MLSWRPAGEEVEAWLQCEKLEEHYELKEAARLGSGKDDDKEARVLNRIVSWTPSGIVYEADPRHGESARTASHRLPV